MLEGKQKERNVKTAYTRRLGIVKRKRDCRNVIQPGGTIILVVI